MNYRQVCPQCGSEGCGPVLCRFTGEKHSVFKANEYAETLIQRDLEQPKWERDLKTGAGNG